MAEGKIIQVIGPVVDIAFPVGQLPGIYNAVVAEMGSNKVTMEALQHLGNDTVRCVALSSTDGLYRGMPAVDTGDSIIFPVGKETLGRMFM